MPIRSPSPMDLARSYREALRATRCYQETAAGRTDSCCCAAPGTPISPAPPTGGGGGANSLDTSRVSARSRHHWRAESALHLPGVGAALAKVRAAGLYAGAVRHAPDQGTTHDNPRLGSAYEYRQTDGAASFVSAAATIGSQSVHEVSARGTGEARPPVNGTFTASGHDLAAVRRPRNRFASSTSIGGNS